MNSTISSNPNTPNSKLIPTTTAEDDLTVSWQKDLSLFLGTIGLQETRQCFDTEMLVLSRYQQEQLPHALETLVERLLLALEQHVNTKENLLSLPPTDQSADVTKGLLYSKKRRRVDVSTVDQSKEEKNSDDSNDLEYQELAKLLDPEQVQIRASNNQVLQRINTYIQAKQHDIDASNRTEFLNRPDPKGEDITCARADAREINRNIQMKFDIVNNEDGPLARSLISSGTTSGNDNHSASSSSLSSTPAVPVAVEERLGNLESHLNVQFEQHPTKPFTWMERIKILESTIMDIERKYPTWAAVHFNQPSRTYPPPPPVTYISRPPTTSALSPSLPPLTSCSSTNTTNSQSVPAVLSPSLPSRPSPSSSPSTASSVLSSIEKDCDYVASQMSPSQVSQHPTCRPSHPNLKLTGRSNSSLTRAVLEQLDKQKRQEIPSTTSDT